jgi:poly(ADP-ribose) glycohydrolase ARH3
LGIEGAQLLASAVAICLRHTKLGRSDLCTELQRRCRTTEYRDKLKLAAEVRTQADLLQLGNGIAAQDSVVTAIACFTLWPDSYEDVIGNAILLGGDTDTIAAMSGAVAGAHLGIDAIPDRRPPRPLRDRRVHRRRPFRGRGTSKAVVEIHSRTEATTRSRGE